MVDRNWNWRKGGTHSTCQCHNVGTSLLAVLRVQFVDLKILVVYRVQLVKIWRQSTPESPPGLWVPP
jgi:hypothetical protein